MQQSASFSLSFPSGFDARRGTFSFDRVLYRDAAVEVTPSLLCVARAAGPRTEIPVQDIAAVWRDFGSRVKPLQRRCARAPRRVRYSRRRTFNNLVLDIRGRASVRVAVACPDPDEAYRAVRSAMQTVY